MEDKIKSGSTTVDIFNRPSSNSSVSDEAINLDDIITKLTRDHIELLKLDTEESYKTLDKIISKIIRQKNLDKSSEDIIAILKSHIFGYGILDKYVNDKSINNIYINKYNDIWIERGRERTEIEESFESNEALESFTRILQSNLGAELNRDKSIATLDDRARNFRIACAIEPSTQDGPKLTIRTHHNTDSNLNLEKLISTGMLSEIDASFLISEIDNGKNIIFIGKGNAGKTTMLRALLNETNIYRRIMVIEESGELRLTRKNTQAYLVKRNDRGKTIGVSELVEHGLISSIDCYVFSEVRGEEALTFCDTAFSGHQFLTTLHGRYAAEVEERLLINMKKSGTDIPSDILLKMIRKSIDYVVYVENLKLKTISRIDGSEISTIDGAKVSLSTDLKKVN